MFNILNRRVKIFKAIEEAVKNNPGIDIDKAIALSEVNFGLSKKRAREYIETLLTAEKIVFKEGKLYPAE